ncbi:unnamed protein product [Owenia fusiformis]|uniref:AF4/FMR2 family member lilli n=1 Tax=Owenia fusiformis TaxID=6347 RepID=A0A8J1TJK2_OWEFU|nr:unnamed protein product [Owenia fusiformis]
MASDNGVQLLRQKASEERKLERERALEKEKSFFPKFAPPQKVSSPVDGHKRKIEECFGKYSFIQQSLNMNLLGVESAPPTPQSKGPKEGPWKYNASAKKDQLNGNYKTNDPSTHNAKQREKKPKNDKQGHRRSTSSSSDRSLSKERINSSSKDVSKEKLNSSKEKHEPSHDKLQDQIQKLLKGNSITSSQDIPEVAKTKHEFSGDRKPMNLRLDKISRPLTDEKSGAESDMSLCSPASSVAIEVDHEHHPSMTSPNQLPKNPPSTRVKTISMSEEEDLFRQPTAPIKVELPEKNQWDSGKGHMRPPNGIHLQGMGKPEDSARHGLPKLKMPVHPQPRLTKPSDTDSVRTILQEMQSIDEPLTAIQTPIKKEKFPFPDAQSKDSTRGDAIEHVKRDLTITQRGGGGTSESHKTSESLIEIEPVLTPLSDLDPSDGEEPKDVVKLKKHKHHEAKHHHHEAKHHHHEAKHHHTVNGKKSPSNTAMLGSSSDSSSSSESSSGTSDSESEDERAKSPPRHAATPPPSTPVVKEESKWAISDLMNAVLPPDKREPLVKSPAKSPAKSVSSDRSSKSSKVTKPKLSKGSSSNDGISQSLSVLLPASDPLSERNVNRISENLDADVEDVWSPVPSAITSHDDLKSKGDTTPRQEVFYEDMYSAIKRDRARNKSCNYSYGSGGSKSPGSQSIKSTGSGKSTSKGSSGKSPRGRKKSVDVKLVEKPTVDIERIDKLENTTKPKSSQFKSGKPVGRSPKSSQKKNFSRPFVLSSSDDSDVDIINTPPTTSPIKLSKPTASRSPRVTNISKPGKTEVSNVDRHKNRKMKRMVERTSTCESIGVEDALESLRDIKPCLSPIPSSTMVTINPMATQPDDLPGAMTTTTDTMATQANNLPGITYDKLNKPSILIKINLASLKRIPGKENMFGQPKGIVTDKSPPERTRKKSQNYKKSRNKKHGYKHLYDTMSSDSSGGEHSGDDLDTTPPEPQVSPPDDRLQPASILSDDQLEDQQGMLGKRKSSDERASAKRQRLSSCRTTSTSSVDQKVSHPIDSHEEPHRKTHRRSEDGNLSSDSSPECTDAIYRPNSDNSRVLPPDPAPQDVSPQKPYPKETAPKVTTAQSDRWKIRQYELLDASLKISDFYLAEGKRLKTQAGAEKGDSFKYFYIFLESMLFFIEAAYALEKANEKDSIDPRYERCLQTYRETYKLFKHNVDARLRSSQSLEHTPKDKKLTALGLRTLSLLSLKLYKLKQRDATKLKQARDDLLKAPSKHPVPPTSQAPSPWNARSTDTPSPMSPTPSPAGSVGSVGSVGSQSSGVESSTSITSNGAKSCQAPQGTIIVSQRLHSVTERLAAIMYHLYTCHELWDQADLLLHHHREFIDECDDEKGTLTLHSSIQHLLHYMRHALAHLNST